MLNNKTYKNSSLVSCLVGYWGLDSVWRFLFIFLQFWSIWVSVWIGVIVDLYVINWLDFS